MDEVPEQLDGAVVRWSAPAMPGCVGHDYATGEPVSIAYFAIARYEGEWESVADAKSVAAHSGKASPSA